MGDQPRLLLFPEMPSALRLPTVTGLIKLFDLLNNSHLRFPVEGAGPYQIHCLFSQQEVIREVGRIPGYSNQSSRRRFRFCPSCLACFSMRSRRPMYSST